MRHWIWKEGRGMERIGLVLTIVLLAACASESSEATTPDAGSDSPCMPLPEQSACASDADAPTCTFSFCSGSGLTCYYAATDDGGYDPMRGFCVCPVDVPTCSPLTFCCLRPSD